MSSKPDTSCILALNFTRFAFILEVSLIIFGFKSEVNSVGDFVLVALLAVVFSVTTVGLFASFLLILCTPLIALWRMVNDGVSLIRTRRHRQS